MKATISAILTLALAGTSHAFVAALYSDQNCQNQIGERNIYDNTCADLGEGIASLKVTTPGAGGQYGRVFTANNCASVNPITCFGVGPPGGSYDTCIPLGDGYNGNAIGSSAVSC